MKKTVVFNERVYSVVLLLLPLLFAIAFTLIADVAHGYHFQTIAFYTGAIVGTISVILLLTRRRHDIDFALRARCSWRDISWAAGYVLLRVLLFLLIVPSVHLQTNGLLLVEQLIFFLLFVAPGEELYFRSFLFSWMQKMFLARMTSWDSLWRAIVISSFLFALVHFSAYLTGWLWLPFYLCDGMVFCILRVKSRSILVPILAHGILDFFTAAALVSPVSVSDRVALLYQLAGISLDLFYCLVLLRRHRRSIVEAQQA